MDMDLLENYNEYDEIIPDDKDFSSSDDYISGLYTYFKDINRYDLLTAEEEKNLFYLYKKGLNSEDKEDINKGNEAKEKLLLHNLRLSVSIAKKYTYVSSLDIDDLIQAGNIGLIKAIEHFDIDKDVKFSSYATYWITQNILRTIGNTGRTVRLPINKIGELREVQKTYRDLEREMFKSPTIKELADYMHKPEEDVFNLLQFGGNLFSLNNAITREEDTELIDFIEDVNTDNPEETFEKNNLSEQINGLMSVLSDKEKDIILKRFGFISEPKTLEEIAIEYGVTKERIRQIESRAIKKLRQRGLRYNLSDFI